MSTRRFLVKYKGLSWSVAVLLLGGILSVALLSFYGKDTAQLGVVITAILAYLVNTARTDQAVDHSRNADQASAETIQAIAGPDPAATAYQAVDPATSLPHDWTAAPDCPGAKPGAYLHPVSCPQQPGYRRDLWSGGDKVTHEHWGPVTA